MLEFSGLANNTDIFKKSPFGKFLRLIPEDYDIFYSIKEDIENIIIKLALVNVTDKLEELGFINGVIVKVNMETDSDSDSDTDSDEDTTYAPSVIKWVGVDENYRGNGIGIFLILLFTTYCKYRGFPLVELDDMTDLARTSSNIYKKLGFKYRIKNGVEPEMIGDANNINNNFNSFKKKYRGKLFV